MHSSIKLAAASLGVASLTVLGTTAASAQTAGGPKTSTPACQVISTQCATPVVAIASLAVNDLNPADDFAMTYQGPSPLTGVSNGPVGVNFNNDLQNGTQDYVWARIATVPHPGGGPGAFNFTGFDRHNYGGDGVYEAKYTPFGVDSGLCLLKKRNRTIVLRTCNGGAQEAWIFDPGTPPGMNAAPSPYGYVLNAPQSATEQHHVLLTDANPAVDDAFLVAQPGHLIAAGHGSGQLWSAIP